MEQLSVVQQNVYLLDDTIEANIRFGNPEATDDELLEAIRLSRVDEITDPRLQLWYDDYLHVAPTGGESFTEQAARVADFIEELRNELAQNEDSSACEVLVFTHGGVLLSAGLWAGWYPLEEAFSHQSPYGAICTLEL